VKGCWHSSSSAKNVEIALSDILLSILEELPSVPSPVIDTLTSQFLPKAIKSRPSAFRLAVEVAKGASDKLQRYVSQYFGETIMATLEGRDGGSDDSEEEEESDDSDDGRKKRKGKGKGKKTPKKTPKGKGKADDSLPEHLVSSHDLIRSLHRHVPSLLLSVIPQLEAELVTTTSPQYRRLATSVLGAMFAEGTPNAGLAKEFPGTWKEWGRRSADREVKVRIAVGEKLGKIWREHPELGGDVEGAFDAFFLSPFLSLILRY
jgi:sister-chromatid-cohesion protein PDS5